MGTWADNRAMRRANRQARRNERSGVKQERREWRRGFIEGLAPKVLDKFGGGEDAKNQDVGGFLDGLEGIGAGNKPKEPMSMQALLPLALVAFLLLKK